MEATVLNGTKKTIEGKPRVYYDGYWIKAYEVPEDTLEHKKQLIEALTRRLFNHVEHGINLPGGRLAEARIAFEREHNPERKRVKGAMLAGALFNRATDTFKKVVEMQAQGVDIRVDNALLNECGEHLKEAFSLGKLVLHRSGEEGIDELWGEPLKAFTFPLQDFYRSRYIKIAQAMAAIDQICDTLAATLRKRPGFDGVDRLLLDLATAAKLKCETLRTDPDIIDIWTSFVITSEKLESFEASLAPDAEQALREATTEGVLLIRAAKALVWSISRARVPMPKSTANFVARCEALQRALTSDENAPPPRTSQFPVRERLGTQTM